MISIIVPVYNVKKYLQKCVESLLGQTYTDFEILLIDDGSTDGSSEICDQLREADSRIRVFHKENGGLSDARNFGIEHAQGEFLLFIDSDDMIHPDFCKVLMDAQKKYNAEIVSTEMLEFQTDEELVKVRSENKGYSEIVFRHNEILKEYFSPSNHEIYHGLCMKMHKRELFDNLWFEKGRLHEDLYITYRLLDRCKTFVYVDVPYYFYLQHDKSIMHNYKEKNFVDEYDALNGILDYFAGRDEIYDYVLKFALFHYLGLLIKITGKECSEYTQQKIHLVKIWIKKNVFQCKQFSFIEKNLFVWKVNFIKLYKVWFEKKRK